MFVCDFFSGESIILNYFVTSLIHGWFNWKCKFSCRTISTIANYLRYKYFLDGDSIDNFTLRLWKFSDFCSRHTVGVAGNHVPHSSWRMQMSPFLVVLLIKIILKKTKQRKTCSESWSHSAKCSRPKDLLEKVNFNDSTGVSKGSRLSAFKNLWVPIFTLIDEGY